MALLNLPAKPKAVQPTQHMEGQMAITTVVPLRGASGRTYDFEVYPWGTPYKPLGAVYVVLRQLNNGQFQIIYIGQTGDLTERFDAHHKAPCFDLYGKTHLGVHLKAGEADRCAIELDLIRQWNPPCNG